MVAWANKCSWSVRITSSKKKNVERQRNSAHLPRWNFLYCLNNTTRGTEYLLFAGLKKRTFGTFTRPTSPQTSKQAALSSDKHFDRSSFTSCFYFSFAFSSHYTLMWAIIPPVRMTTNYSPTNSRCSQVGHCSRATVSGQRLMPDGM